MPWLIAAMALMAIGTGISAYGLYGQGQAQKQMNQYNAVAVQRQAEMTRQAATTNVSLTQTKAMGDTKELQRKYALVEGAQRAARAAQGIGGGSVTEGDIATDTFNTRKLDEDMIRYNADLRSWAIKNQAAGEEWGLKTQAEQYTYAGKDATRAGAIAGTGTIFSGAGNIASMGAMYNMYKMKV